MVKNKFRLSDIIPGSWLRKLKRADATSSSRKLLLLSGNKEHRFENPPAPTLPRWPSPLDHAHRRKSYHFPRQPHEVQPHRLSSPPRRSTSKHRRSAHLRRPTRRSSPRLVNTSVSACCICRAFARFHLARAKPGCLAPVSLSDSPSSTEAIFPQSPPSFRHSSRSVPSSCKCRANFDGTVTLARGFHRDPLSELELSPIVTTSVEFNETVTNSRKGGENKNPVAANNHRNSSSSSSVLVNIVKKETNNRTVRAKNEQKKPRPIVNLVSSSVGGVRLRVNSPKVGSRKPSQAHQLGRKSMSAAASSLLVTNIGTRTRRSGGASDGVAVMKSSADPWKDFRESMVEMIVENDLRASKDLEELLACYLTLNSDEYHDIIIGVFKQIWFDFCRPWPN